MILIANPGSASRKYALFAGEQLRASLHFEETAGHVVCTLMQKRHKQSIAIAVPTLAAASQHIMPLLREHNALQASETITRIGLRVVAPGSYFLQDRLLNDEAVQQLTNVATQAPIHVQHTLEEFRRLQQQFPHTPVVGISDTQFHANKSDRAWNYGLPLHDTDRFEIKRFGYHGISVAAVVERFVKMHKMVPKMVVAHVGGGASVSAVHQGKSIDNTMGYSPLDGVIMSTRAGSLDVMAAHALQHHLQLNTKDFESYLHHQSGLYGLGGSADVRELLAQEQAGNHQAALALQTYVFNLQKAIGQMTAVLGGIDMLVLTGTVCERSALIRQRLLEPFGYLDLHLQNAANNRCNEPTSPALISKPAQSKPIFVVPASEAEHMAQQVAAIAL